MTRVATGAAPGKVILFGEHAVVHGRPAIACTLPDRGVAATCLESLQGPRLDVPEWGQSVRPAPADRTLEAVPRAFALALEAAGLPFDAPVLVTMEGNLPPSVGMGSSAAFSVALVRALADFAGRSLGESALLDAAARLEGVFHGDPSGLDHTTVALGGCVHYRRGVPGATRRIGLGAPLPVAVGFTARAGNTKQLVGRLKARAAAHPGAFGPVFDAIGALADEGEKALVAGDLERLGVLFDVNHGLVNALGVSTLVCEVMVARAREAGALGAKLTGAGGGGSIIAVCASDADADAVARALETLPDVRAFSTRLASPTG
jgi:mevalonate kinase